LEIDAIRPSERDDIVIASGCICESRSQYHRPKASAGPIKRLVHDPIVKLNDLRSNGIVCVIRREREITLFWRESEE